MNLFIARSLIVLSCFLSFGAVASDMVWAAGKVRFEKHQTMALPCVECAPSQAYWTIVLRPSEPEAVGTTYEIDVPYSTGMSEAPEAVDLNGVLIRPGSYIQVQGRVRYARSGYVLLTDVSDVRHVMDAKNDEY